MPTETTTPPAAAPVATPESPVVTAPPAADPPLGDPGLKALNEERAARAAAEKEAKAAKAELEKIKTATMSENEKAIAEAEARGRTEERAALSQTVIRSEVKAAAAGKLADPADALGLLGDLSRFVTDTGDVDSKALSSAIDELVKTKPYLAPAGRPGALPGGGAKPSDGASMDDFIRKQARG